MDYLERSTVNHQIHLNSLATVYHHQHLYSLHQDYYDLVWVQRSSCSLVLANFSTYVQESSRGSPEVLATSCTPHGDL